MSYYTRVEFHFEAEPPAITSVEESVRAYFDSENYAVDDIVATFQRGFAEGVAEFNRMECADIEGLMLLLSQKNPACKMCVRGSGEEWRDYWLREFHGGKLVFSVGPFLEGKKPAFFRFFFGDNNS